MSKLAAIRYAQNAAYTRSSGGKQGEFLGALIPGLGSIIGGLGGLGGIVDKISGIFGGGNKPKPTAPIASIAAGSGAGLIGQILGGAAGGAAGSAASAAFGAAGGGYRRRRGRGITATELRGYRKVSSLLHREGMVSKRARGRKCK